VSIAEESARAGGFTVVLARSHRTVFVEEGRTILETLLDAGLNPSYSCMEGVCATCETRVLEGVPDHRDLVLNDAERAAGKTMMICCSRAKTPTLVLDL
jgi:vanillate O-demethylase ferredoxin subunit